MQILDVSQKRLKDVKKNPKNSSTTKLGEHIPSGFSLSTISSFKSIEDKHDIQRGKDCMKKFCKSLREHKIEVILKRGKMKLLTKIQQKSYESVNICYICEEKLEDKFAKDKKYHKFNDHCNYTVEQRDAAHSMCNLKFSVPKKIIIVFHNRSNYDYHFIIKEPVEEFEGQFSCLGKNSEKYIAFSVLIEKEVTRIDKNGKEITKSHIFQITIY